MLRIFTHCKNRIKNYKYDLSLYKRKYKYKYKYKNEDTNMQKLISFNNTQTLLMNEKNGCVIKKHISYSMQANNFFCIKNINEIICKTIIDIENEYGYTYKHYKEDINKNFLIIKLNKKLSFLDCNILDIKFNQR
jgi:hypothetical protein